jgi:hypothetical protein
VVTVTQADEQAASSLWDELDDNGDPIIYDADRVAEAFARHRIAAEQRVYERARKQAAGVADRLGKERGAAADKAKDHAVYLVEVERENQSRCIAAAILSMKKEDADTIERVIAALSRSRSLANEVGKHLAADTSSF